MNIITNLLKSFIEFLIQYKEIITILLGIIIGFIPSLFEIRNKEKKNKLNKAGVWFIFFVCSLISFSIFTIIYENGNLTQEKISIRFSFRSNSSNITDNELSKLIPNEIPALNIKFGEAQTSGIFKLKLYDPQKNHSFSSKFAQYTCTDLLITNIENFPKRISEVQNSDVIINFPMSNFLKDFSINEQPVIKIGDDEYLGEIIDDKIYFNIKDEKKINM